MSLPGFSGSESTVIEGVAEIFGTELTNDYEYTFTGIKSAIYSLGGAKIEYTGELSSEYISEETQMDAYINLHFALENLRFEASTTTKKGPRVLILGAKDSGKTTLTKILAAYANRLDHQPLVVNLNPDEVSTLTATPISDILDVEHGWGQSYTTGPTLLHPKQPTVRYYGLETIEENEKFYKHNVSRLGVTACSRLEEDEIVNKSGMIINTPPLKIKDAPLVEDIISDFEVDVLVVVGNERLYIDLRKRFKEKVTIVKVPKSGGCVERDDTFIRQCQQKSIREYFYGTPKTVLSPYTVHVDFSIVTVYKPFVEQNNYISSVLPIGEEGEEEEDKKSVKLLEKIEPSSSALQNAVVAFLQADKTDEEDIVLRSGVTDVDDTKTKLRVLIPVPGRLPDKAMILGAYRYVE
ncbi:hypothetical protein BN7_19 [Wickerhamomyces ciferrii]|uniref:Polynucleotide 5'-hydroxyl-kinase GRC3 n=1 Tax=Wickerhamomyces ciferrii (strain ATCC 14091 / BCRC 22168 / CBS 111 / JCM 3599 / NBRC 0793 / NRRL Y-1031 F-60-10) TaxID=1206466 RepID=K0KC64_WICCF|nr:uncharacterized protein BN7_19 [Wickerhamomyces ciferrii]CCH40486.1 hypothetical protein BN7_19 [Wickerhamomyces ciferrii]